LSEKERYFAESLAWSIRTDYEFVRWLVDTLGLQPQAISNRYTRALYEAASKTYAKLAPRGSVPGVDDVILSLSDAIGSDESRAFAAKIYSMSQPGTLQARDVAVSLLEQYRRGVIVEQVQNWIDGVDESDKPIGQQFASLVENVASVVIGKEKTGRPKDIIESAWAGEKIKPQSTGYERLDKAIDGGFTPGYLYIWGMPSGHGKSSFCCNLASRRAEVGLPTIIHSLEMSSARLLFRMICDLAQVSIDVAKDPDKATGEESDRIAIAIAILDQYVRVYDSPAGPQEMSIRVRRHTIEFGQVPILNEVDHMGIVDRAGKNEWSELEAMAYSFAALASSTSNPFLVYSQVTGDQEKEMLANNIVVYNRDLRGSRGIRNAGDVILLGWKHTGLKQTSTASFEYMPQYMNHTVIQAVKNRDTGRLFWGLFQYNPVYYRVIGTRGEGTEDDKYV